MQEMISIITPTWNAGHLIERCMKSVAEQVGTDYEHIIIDGGSTDNTVDVCKANASPFTRIITNRDKWIYEKMNDGIQAAKGEWIYFISADDELISRDVLYAFTFFTYLHPKADIIYGDIYSQRLGRMVDGEFDAMKILTRNVPVVFYRKRLFESVGLFNVKYKILADHDFSLRCWLSGRVRHQYVPLTTITYADGGVSSTSRDRNFMADHFGICVRYILGGSWPVYYKAFLLLLLPCKIIKRKIFSMRVSYWLMTLIAVFMRNPDRQDHLLRSRYDRK